MENIYFKDETSGILGDHRRCVCNDHRITGSDFRNRIIKNKSDIIFN